MAKEVEQYIFWVETFQHLVSCSYTKEKKYVLSVSPEKNTTTKVQDQNLITSFWGPYCCFQTYLTGIIHLVRSVRKKPGEVTFHQKLQSIFDINDVKH